MNYLNRDISWLAFNMRVADEAEKDIPLSERVMFHGITFSNLDEFLMTRYPSAVEESGDEKVEEFRKAVIDHHATLISRFTYTNVKEEIIVPVVTLHSTSERKWMEKYFRNNVFPALQPITISKTRIVEPHKGLNIFVECYDGKAGDTSYHTIEVPSSLERFIKLPESNSYVALEDVIMTNLNLLFRGRKIVRACTYGVLRSAEVYTQTSNNIDQYKMIEQTLQEREKSWITRLEVGTTDKKVVKLVKSLLPITSNTLVFPTPNFINLADIKALDNSIFEADQQPRKLVGVNPFPAGDIFEYIRDKDRLVFHPYESYADSFVRFIEESAADPNVVSMKITLYRVANKSRIIDALLKAADNGKLVTVLVELKARFDEHHNIKISRILKEGGVRMVYGSAELKTHAKVCLITRKEKKGLRVYSHVGTGNYNESNAKLYTDYSYFTADQEIGNDLTRFFNLLTSDQDKFKSQKIIYAPYNLRSEISDNIDTEIKKAKAKKTARIVFKCNALTDDKIADKLVKAAEAGVKITLIVRGACIIRPIKNIRIYSVVGRFLEHSRVYMFGAKSHCKVYIGSNDMMYRNLDRRNELMIFVKDKELRSRIRNHIKCYLEDTVNRREIKDEYSYVNIVPKMKEKEFNSQKYFIKEAKEIQE